MGLLIGIIRMRQLKLMQSNCEWKLQLIAQAVSTAQNSANNLLQVSTDYEADSAVDKKLQQRQYNLKALAEKLNAQKAALEIQLKEINAEMESCRGMIDAHIKDVFSYRVS